MAQFAACIRESKCTSFRIHQQIKKNSVQLKEVLTQQGESVRKASNDDATMRAQTNAKNARAASIRESQYCRKRLSRSAFRDSHIDRWMHVRCACESLRGPGSACRGLRVFQFGKKKIFMINGGVGHRGRGEAISLMRIDDRRFATSSVRFIDGLPRVRKKQGSDRRRSRAPFRGRASTSKRRSQLWDQPCRQSTSSPGRRTTGSPQASPLPAQPCPDWPR